MVYLIGETDHSMFGGRAWDVCWQNMVCLLAEADHGMSADRSNQEERCEFDKSKCQIVVSLVGT